MKQSCQQQWCRKRKLPHYLFWSLHDLNSYWTPTCVRWTLIEEDAIPCSPRALVKLVSLTWTVRETGLPYRRSSHLKSILDTQSTPRVVENLSIAAISMVHRSSCNMCPMHGKLKLTAGTEGQQSNSMRLGYGSWLPRSGQHTQFRYLQNYSPSSHGWINVFLQYWNRVCFMTDTHYSCSYC